MDAQYFLIGTDGRQYGPLSQDDVRTWLADGRASRYSRARRDSEPQWAALRDFPEFEDETRPPHLGAFDPNAADDDAPALVAPRPSTQATSTGAIDPIACFRRAWFLVSRDFGVLAGWTLLSAMVVVGLSLIPGVGGVLAMPANYLLQGGLYVLFLSRMRGLSPSIGDVALTVRGAAARLVTAGLVQALITLPVLLITVAQSRPYLLALVGLLMVPCIYLLVGYVFVLPLIVDKHLPVWGAMERSRAAVQRTWIPTFGLLIAAGMLIFVSAAALGFGLVLTLPLCTAALMFAYEDLFSEP
jgi:hypothetical protein